MLSSCNILHQQHLAGTVRYARLTYHKSFHKLLALLWPTSHQSTVVLQYLSNLHLVLANLRLLQQVIIVTQGSHKELA